MPLQSLGSCHSKQPVGLSRCPGSTALRRYSAVSVRLAVIRSLAATLTTHKVRTYVDKQRSGSLLTPD
jgi:hypothetical protein